MSSRGLGKREVTVEKFARERHDPGATHRVVMRAALGAGVLADRIGAVRRVDRRDRL